MNDSDITDESITLRSPLRERLHRRKRNRDRTVTVSVNSSQVASSSQAADKPFCLEDESGVRVFFGVEGLRVGRDPSGCDLVLPDDDVSRLHCVLSVVGDTVCVHNHGVNGSFVNGTAVGDDSICALRDGDVLSLAGPARHIFRYSVFAVAGRDDLPTSFVNRLHRYELGRTIGEGSFAAVREAYDRELGRRVAVKILDKANFFSEQAFLSIHAEIEMMRSLDHEHVVRVLDAFEEEEMLALVMELAEGGDLFDYLVGRGRNPFTEDEARFLFVQLLEAVVYIHARRIVHCDLKPENILVQITDSASSTGDTEALPLEGTSASGSEVAASGGNDEASTENAHQRRARALSPYAVCLKLTDFGVAKYRGERDDADALRVGGTAVFSAPELSLGASSAPPREDAACGSAGTALSVFSSAVDVWSLGVLLFLMCSGSLPRQPAPGRRVTFYRTMRQLSDPCLQLISAMICVEPAGRISLADICTHPWLAGHQVRGAETLAGDAETMSATLQLSPLRGSPTRHSWNEAMATPAKAQRTEANAEADDGWHS